MSSRCANCGFENPPGMRFCGNCGTRLSEVPPAGGQKQLSSMMGGNLMARFQAAGLEAAGQRRNVTVLFVDLSGYTQIASHLDPEDVYYLVQEYLKSLAECVYQYDGFVDKFLGDGLMALFGAPIAQENNAEMALRSVLEMQKTVAALNKKHQLSIELHAGLHSGTVIVGGIGSDMLMDYTAIGNTVNLASRLEDAASAGDILVSENVYQQTKALFRFLRKAPIEVKGIDAPVPVYKVIGERAQRGLVRGLEGITPPMVGRQKELQTVLNAARQLYEHSRGGLVIIRADGGMGKSRLVREAKAHLEDRKVRIIEGYSLTYRRSVAYWVFRDALRNFIKAPQNASEEWLRTTFRKHGQEVLGIRYKEHRAYLEYVLGLPPETQNDKDRLTQLEAEQLRQRIYIAMRDFFIFAARRRPLLLILEDLHWADETSLGLLGYLLNALRESPILIIGVTRPTHAQQLQEIIDRAQILRERFALIELNQLTYEQSATLLSGLLNEESLPEDFQRQILERADGIPFYLEEIVRMLLDRGVLERIGNYLKVARIPEGDLAQLGVPDSLQGLILTRFDKLPPLARRILQVASAIGRQFNIELLREVLRPEDETTFAQNLRAIIEREFVASVPEAPPGEYTFRHELVSDAIYGTILRRERTRLHGRIGEAIEKLHADRISEYIELLARHYAWSDRPDRALHYLLLAGQRALHNYANEQAGAHFSQAVALLGQCHPTLRQYVHAHTGLGDVLLFDGKYPEAFEHYDAALQRLSQAAGQAYALPHSTLQRKIATAYERQGKYDDALTLLQGAENTLDTTARLHPVERAQIIEEMGWIHFRRGDLDKAEAYLLRALELVENSNAYAVIASIYNRLGGVYYQKDNLEKAGQYVQRSLKLREQVGDLVALARSYNNLGLLHWKAGQWAKALEYFRKSLNLNEVLGDVEAIALMNNNIGLLYTDQGDVDSAQKHLDIALEITRTIGHAHLEGQVYLHRSRLQLSRQNWAQAIEDSNRGLEIFKRIGSQEHLIDLYLTQVEAHLGLDAPARAEEILKVAFQSLQRNFTKAMEASSERGRALHLAAQIAMRYEQWERAEKLITESLQNLQTTGNQLEYARTLLILAKLHKERNRPEEAIEAATQAANIFKALGAKPDLQRLSQIKVLDLSLPG